MEAQIENLQDMHRTMMQKTHSKYPKSDWRNEQRSCSLCTKSINKGLDFLEKMGYQVERKETHYRVSKKGVSTGWLPYNIKVDMRIYTKMCARGVSLLVAKNAVMGIKSVKQSGGLISGTKPRLEI